MKAKNWSKTEVKVTRSSERQHWTFGEKVADSIAEFGGSWTFLILFFLFLLCWMGINVVAIKRHPFDPYPFILLNLILSCIAAVQAPIILMSQRRKEAKDRVQSQYDYQVNLKAELEIRQLHEKVDELKKAHELHLEFLVRIEQKITKEIAEKRV